MQGIQDLVYPVFKGILDITTSIIPGTGSGGGGGSGKKGVEFTGHGSSGGVVSSSSKASSCGRVVNCCGGIKDFPVMSRSMIRIAGLSGALAVGLGAYGAHVIMLNDKFPEEQKHSFRTANMYHFIGTFGLVASSLAKYPLVTGVLMATGTFLFCGSCYYHGITGDTGVKKFAPFGGTTLILAWLSLIL